MGCGDHPHVGRSRMARADSTHLSALEDPQQLGLQSQGEVADLVQEERPASGVEEQPIAILGRTGKGPAPMTEQLRLHQGLGQRRGVHDQEGPVRPIGVRMQRPGDQVLA